MTEQYFLVALSILIPIIIGIPISAYITLLIQRKMKKEDMNEIISNLKNSIKQEIQENIVTVNEEDVTITKKGKWDRAIINILTTASYESSVNSGNFTLLPSNLRKDISELYTFIDIANRHTGLLVKSQFVMVEDKDRFKELIENQLKHFTENHQEVLTRSNSLLKKL